MIPTRFGRARGYTDGRHTIWLSEHLTEAEARCTLAHELVHIEEGHIGHQPPATEERVRAVVAQRLVPWDALVHYSESNVHSWHIADELGVTHDVLHDRLRYATTHEMRQLRERKL